MNNVEEIDQKIQQYESFISLYLRRENTLSILSKLKNKSEDVYNLQLESSNLAAAGGVSTRLKLISKRMQMQQLTIVNILLELQKRDAKVQGISKSLGIPKIYLSAVEESAKKERKGMITLAEKLMKGGAETPKMYLYDYQQSPFVRRTRPVPVPFQFLDFEATITLQMFETIPKYMRGRDSVDELSNFLDTIIIPSFNEKYQLLHRLRDCIRNPSELDMWKVYRDQSNYFPGQKFITQGDITRKLQKMLDKKTQNKIIMLRQLRILQEQRKNQVICYIWLINNDN